MGVIVRPRFGRPCFECGDTVPHQRIRILEDDAAANGRRFLKSDLICVECRNRQEREERQAGGDETIIRPRPRR